jgi:hypothetical protein
MKKSHKKTFLAIYLGTAASMKKWEKLSPKIRKQREIEGVQAWMKWAQKNKKAIVKMGGPLGTTKKASRKGVANTRNELGAFTIVTATSHAAAAKLFKNHPHFTIFPGDRVEVMECLPIPRM